MALARTWSVALVGVTGHLVEIEADLANGLPKLALIGLPDTALSEARDRVRAAVVNSGESWPNRRITLALSPAMLPKKGSGFDLAIAIAVLAAAGALPPGSLHDAVVLGELALDGRLRPGRGVLPAVLAAARAGRERVVVPAVNQAEAELVPGVEVVGVRTLRELVARLRGEPFEVPLDEEDFPPAPAADERVLLDLEDVLGQPIGRQAVEIAAAGGHHLFLLGPPGAGKTMLAERLPGLLPPLDIEAALEVTAIHSLTGQLPPGVPLVTRAPYEAPHHTSTVPAIIGGGVGLARPGAVSRAHRGVLFLDEAPEFPRRALDALRQPLEAGEITLSRSGGQATYPARFSLVLAANPCPCSSAGGHCTCSADARRRYLAKLSGPLLDRVDLQVEVLPLSRADLLSELSRGEPTAAVAERVAEARDRAARRLRGTPWRTNGEVPGQELRRTWRPAAGSTGELERRLELGALTARGVDRVLRVAWTVADLAGVDRPGLDEVAAALGLRGSVPAVAA